MLTLPYLPYLTHYLEDTSHAAPLSAWRTYRQQQTAGYRSQQITTAEVIRSRSEAQVYLLARMPAIYAVVKRVLREALALQPIAVESLLDLGSGPGTATWAAHQVWPQLQRVEWLERNRWLRELAQEIARAAHLDIKWAASELTNPAWPVQRADIVSLSYVLNELSSEQQLAVLNQAWQKTSQWLIVIEPGTPAGFAVIRNAREYLLQAGGHVVAPCPHEQSCPMTANDWCHFAQRLSRSAEQRFLKDAEKGYEDEKFSYLVVSRQPLAQAPAGRILRHPIARKGYFECQLCTPQGCTTGTITRRDPRYKQARKLAWGDAWPS